MEKLNALPGQIILTVALLINELQSAAEADTVQAVRKQLAVAIERAEIINQLACDAQLAADSDANPNSSA